MTSDFLKEMDGLLTDLELKANTLVAKQATIRGEMERLSGMIVAGQELIKTYKARRANSE